MSDTDLHQLTGAYATGALTNSEHDAFVAHLVTCGNCRDEVAELVATATLLGIAAAERPPAGFRERLMAEVAQTRQLPPVVTTLAEARARKQPRRWVMSAAAAAVVIAAGVGAWGLSMEETSGPSVSAIAAIQTAADAKTMKADTGSGATATLIMSRSQGGMVFMAHGLRDAGDKRTYQVWLLGPGSAVTSMGTFDSDGEANTARLFQGPGGATALAVTEEPSGGSARPTSKPVLAMDIPREA